MPHAPHFDGATYEPKFDHTRLTGQLGRVYSCMKDGGWRSLAQISEVTNDPQASVSARLRDLRKLKFGDHSVERERIKDPNHGIFVYRLIIIQKKKPEQLELI